jgi:hypothetical protein
MSEVVDPEHAARSVAFYEDSNHYLHVDLNKYPIIIDCIDPRNKFVGEFFSKLVTVQGPGGKIGVGHDMAIAQDASHNLGPSTAKEGADIYSRIGPGVAYPHDNVCRYAKGYAAVAHEERNPSDYTRDTLERWYDIHGFEPSNQIRNKVKDAQSRHLELTLAHGGEQNPDDFIDPKWSEVERAHMHVVGPNLSRSYIVTHPNDIRVDRDTRRRMGVQGYHDNIGAMLEIYANLKVSGRQKEILGLLALSRSVATRTIVGMPYPDMSYREVFPAPHMENGIEIRAVDGPS